MRLPWQAVAGGVLVAALGAAGLVRGAVPQSAASDPPSGGASDPIVVTGAYVRPPVPPTKLAAAYFTVYNTTAKADRLTSISTGAGASSTLHILDSSGAMRVSPNGAAVPAKGKLVLSTGTAHVMIAQLFGPLKAGDRVNIELQFRDAGPIDVVAPVVPFGTNPPQAARPSGAHS